MLSCSARKTKSTVEAEISTMILHLTSDSGRNGAPNTVSTIKAVSIVEDNPILLPAGHSACKG